MDLTGTPLFSSGNPGVVSGGPFAVTGTFFQATQPISAAALPLPTNAATSALQTTGNGTLTTINTTLGSPFQAGGSIGNTTFASTQGTSPWVIGGPAAVGTVPVGNPVFTGMFDGTDIRRVMGDETNGLWVNIKAGATGGGAVTIANGADVVLGNNGDSANCASATSLIACIRQVNAELVTLNSTALLPVPQGGPFGNLTDVPCTLPASATSCGQISLLKAAANAINSPPPLGTANGWTPLKLAALTNTAVVIKGSSTSGGQLGKLYCANTNSTMAYVQVFNVAAASVTVGTTASIPYGIPANGTAGYVMDLVGDQYSNTAGFSIAATTTATGGTALGTALDCNVSYN
jgi:hypothetical protein